MNELLNDSQWNSLRISILAFERRLREARDWLDGREEEGKFYRRRLSMSEDGREFARQQIEQALREVAVLGTALQVPFSNEAVNSELRGEFSVTWANLLDSRAAKLARFGDVHPKLAAELDPIIEQLAEAASLLAAVFGESDKENP
jgi:hypothetical protein